MLERRAETPHASYEPSFREATPGLGDDRVAPLRFEGSRFRWPLVDVDRLRAFNWARIANERLFLPQPLELLRALFDSGVEFSQHIDQQPFVVTKTDPNGDAEEPIAYRYPVADWSFEDVLHDVIERLGKDAVRQRMDRWVIDAQSQEPLPNIVRGYHLILREPAVRQELLRGSGSELSREPVDDQPFEVLKRNPSDGEPVIIAEVYLVSEGWTLLESIVHAAIRRPALVLGDLTAFATLANGTLALEQALADRIVVAGRLALFALPELLDLHLVFLRPDAWLILETEAFVEIELAPPSDEPFRTVTVTLEDGSRSTLARGYPKQAFSLIEALADALADIDNLIQGLLIPAATSLGVARWLPENPLRHVVRQLNDLMRNVNDEGPRATFEELRHATRVAIDKLDQADTVERVIEDIVPVDPDALLEPGRLNPIGQVRAQLAKHKIAFNFNSLKFGIEIDPSEIIPDNLIIDWTKIRRSFDDLSELLPSRQNWFKLPFVEGCAELPGWDPESILNSLPLDDIFDDGSFDADALRDLLWGEVTGTMDVPVFLKLESGRSLEAVIKDLPESQAGIRRNIEFLLKGGVDQEGAVFDRPLIDPLVNAPSWTGAILLQPGLQFLESGLAALLPEFLAKPMRYVALTALRKDGRSDAERASVMGTFSYKDPYALFFDEGMDTTDVFWGTQAVDLRFRDQEILSFQILGTLLVRKFLVDNINNNKKNESDEKVRGPVKFEILGRFESAGVDSNPTNKDRIIFEATSENPIVIEVNRLFIEKVTISGVRVEIGGLGNEGAPDTSFEIDGDLKLEKLPAGGDLLQIDMSKPIRFEKLRLPLIPGSVAVDWEWPSLALPVKQARPLRLGPIGFSIERIGFGLPEVFDGSLDILGHDLDLEKRFPWIDLKIGLFKYPDLNPKAGLPFGFNLVLGVPDIANGKVKATLKGLDFDKLDIDLFRFIRLKAKNLEIGSPSGPLGGEVNTLIWLLAQDVELEILGRRIVDKLSVYVVSRSGKYAFIAYLEDVFDGKLVSINWVLLANSWPLGPVAPLLLGLQDATSGDLYKAIKKQVVAAASNPGLIVGGHMAGR